MNNDIDSFVEKARTLGLSSEEIKAKLIDKGWTPVQAEEAVSGLVVPEPPKASPPTSGPLFHHASDKPIAVVQNLSTRGFEYSIMFLTLWASAFSIMWLALSFVKDSFSRADGSYQYGVANTGNAFVITLLLVTFPIFAYMFLRLKKAELSEPTLRDDPSRRKLTQMTQLVSFVTALGFTIYFVYSIIAPDSSSASSAVQRLLQTLVALVVAGGVFLFYWKDEHKRI